MPSNRAHSVLERLRTLAKREGREYQATLLLYAQERWLARLAASQFRPRFVLKGGLFLYSRYRSAARPTQDMDFAGRATPNDASHIAEIMRQVAQIELEDGVVFNPDTLTASSIAEDAKYAGVRVKLEAQIGRARLPITLDVGFGDEIAPAPSLQPYPTLLPAEPLKLFTVWLETVIAEKFQAMVMLGDRNTRLKDFYDLYRIASSETLEAIRLRTALDRTFARRETPLEAARTFLERGFADDANRQQLWQGYLRRTKLEAPESFDDVMTRIRVFLVPIIENNGAGAWQPDRQSWLE